MECRVVMGGGGMRRVALKPTLTHSLSLTLTHSLTHTYLVAAQSEVDGAPTHSLSLTYSHSLTWLPHRVRWMVPPPWAGSNDAAEERKWAMST